MKIQLPILLIVALFTPSHAEEDNSVTLTPQLGAEFGKVIEIEGVVVTHKDTRLRKHVAAKLLKVESVNQVKLKLPVIVELDPFPFAELEMPQRGTPAKMRGYETGAFMGIPDEAMKNFPAATYGFHFEHRFLVMKVLSPKQRRAKSQDFD